MNIFRVKFAQPFHVVAGFVKRRYAFVIFHIAFARVVGRSHPRHVAFEIREQPA